MSKIDNKYVKTLPRYLGHVAIMHIYDVKFNQEVKHKYKKSKRSGAMFEITEKFLLQHVQKIIDTVYNIELDKLSVLVGPNGVGKSLIRKQMSARLRREFGEGTKKCVRQISMELRTTFREEFDALSMAAHDNDVSPTSVCTYELLKEATRGLSEDKQMHFYVFDEPDIGMSLESEVGIANIIIGMKDSIEQNAVGGLVITHSATITRMLVEAGCPFHYIGYNEMHNDFDKWINREVVPTDFEWLDKWSSSLFLTVRDYKKK